MNVFDQFEEKPFGPLAEHMAKVKECVSLVGPMFECVRQQNYEELKRISQQVFKEEHKADQIKNHIRETMPKSFYLPIYRGDLLAYLKLQDDIADSAEDVAVVLTIKRLVMPASIADHIMNLVRQVLQVCTSLFECSENLRDLSERDFGGRRVREILDLVAQAEREEWETDKTQFDLAQKLFALEDEMRATDIFLWSNVFQNLGKLANHADKTAERLRRMLIR
ncbi:MAG: TIGR00153 family protein [Phycisphaerales bacterium]|nr:TIGR00153 family protein [Phycisphaerales bacterium]